ncbi:NUDIX hydrolase [Pseudooceanicola sp.]|uniref:NUDIX hydrolase n=1 Tax=Pseudooceanicola sp. TaxID=1914328 RepID=UPI0040585344
MSLVEHSSLTLPFPPGLQSEVRTQYAALCYRIVQDKPQFLLITSRGTRRWIVPKGWPMTGRTAPACALREAYEEAGVIGHAAEDPLGVYPYMKLLNDGSAVPCAVLVYAVRVTALRAEFPEAGERRRKWYRRKKAARTVGEPALSRIILGFDPGQVALSGSA